MSSPTVAVCCWVSGHVSAQAVIPMGQRLLQPSFPLRFGEFADSRFRFHGDMAHMVVLNTPITPEQLMYTFKVPSHRP